MENKYIHTDTINQKVAHGKHRQVVGGMWDELGVLQFEYLKTAGLNPDHTLLDVGCGSLRGGVHFIPYLKPRHYYGFDINSSLIDAGLNTELPKHVRRSHTAKENFASAENFAYPSAWQNIDFALGISVFTHLSINTIKLCLWQTHKVLKPNGIFYATVFLVENSHLYEAYEQAPNIISHPAQDPFHYTLDNIQALAQDTGFNLIGVDDFSHPRNQKMATFEKM